MYRIIYQFIVVCATEAIILPGSCPDALHSHSLPEFETFSIIYSIPFSANKSSYLFREIVARDIKYYKIHFFQSPVHGEHQIVKYNTIRVDTRNTCTNVARANNASITLNSTISLKSPKSSQDLECVGTIEEEVRVWFDGRYIFLWSCVDDESKEERDEAVIIGTVRDTMYPEYEVDPTKDIVELKEIASIYLSEALVNLVNLSYPDNLWEFGNQDIIFNCSEKKVLNHKNVVPEINFRKLFFTGFFLFIILGWCVILIKHFLKDVLLCSAFCNSVIF